MKTKAFVAPAAMLFACMLFVSACSKDDNEQPPEDTTATCEVTGSIDEAVVGTWTGEIYFNSNNTSYAQSHSFRTNGTVLATGPEVPDLNGCWRVSGESLRYAGTLRYNGITVNATFTGRIVTPDSIYGTHSADNGESGIIWMTR